MATVAELTARRDALQAALHSGLLTIREGDKSVTYQSAEVMRQVLAGIQAELGAAAGGKPIHGLNVRPRKGW